MEEHAPQIGPKRLSPFGQFLQAIGLLETQPVIAANPRPPAPASLRAQRKRARQNRLRGRRARTGR